MAEKWTDRLLSWFDSHERDLPWREQKPRNPYHVWVSEIMLQQTRTEAVKPYFQSWMERFPTISDLAAATEADVLHAWQGLGYYARARHLHEAARIVAQKYGGALPADKKELLSLPGIGAYTAGAILSMAFGRHETAIDGNVLRVYARLYGIEKDILKREGRREIERLAGETLPERAGDFNEALMDLGSLICIPGHPHCKECPLKGTCRAWKMGKADILPVRTKKKAPKEVETACAVHIRDGKVLLHLRPARGMLASMWEFPMTTGKTAEEARKALEDSFHGTAEELLWTHTHVFTHRVWHMKAYLFPAGTFPRNASWRFYSIDEYKKIPLAGPHSRLAAAAEKWISSL